VSPRPDGGLEVQVRFPAVAPAFRGVILLTAMSLATARNILIIPGDRRTRRCLVPGGGTGANVALQALYLTFLATLGWFGVVMYRQHRTELYSLGDRRRAIVYRGARRGRLSRSLAPRGCGRTGAGSVVWLVLIAGAVYAVAAIVWSAPEVLGGKPARAPARARPGFPFEDGVTRQGVDEQLVREPRCCWSPRAPLATRCSVPSTSWPHPWGRLQTPGITVSVTSTLAVTAPRARAELGRLAVDQPRVARRRPGGPGACRRALPLTSTGRLCIHELFERS